MTEDGSCLFFVFNNLESLHIIEQEKKNIWMDVCFYPPLCMYQNEHPQLALRLASALNGKNELKHSIFALVKT